MPRLAPAGSFRGAGKNTLDLIKSGGDRRAPFRQCNRMLPEHDVRCQGLRQIGGRQSVEMLPHRSQIAALEGPRQSPRGILAGEICHRALNQRQKNLARARGTQTANREHLEGDIEQRRHVWGSRQGSRVIKRFVLRVDDETLATQIAYDRPAQADSRRIAFN